MANGDSNDPMLVSFGVNAESGGLLTPQVSPDGLAQVAVTEEQARQMSAAEQGYFAAAPQGKDTQFDDITDLNETGWGVIFAETEAAAVKQAVQKLIDYRGAAKRVFSYKAGESHVEWIRRNGGEPGAVDASRIPYYLCIIGGPDQIPFEFQFNLDIEYAVGRLCFDTAADYAQYIANVMDYEKGKPPTNRKQVTLMATANRNDGATPLSSQYLILPLLDALGTDPKTKAYTTALYFPPSIAAGRHEVLGEMNKPNLTALFASSNDKLPALLITASHGWGYTHPDPAQPAVQGALVCQEWMAGNSGPIFAAADVPDSADLRGMVVLAFACFGAGTPRMSYYKRLWGSQQDDAGATNPIADADFVAALPKKLMARPNGILGFFGHIEQTWAHSFVHKDSASGNLVADIEAFNRAVQRILKGYPLGYALNTFNDRNATYTAEVTDLMSKRLSNQPVDDKALGGKWTDRNDARALIFLGDPGVRLRVNELH